ncbi:peptidylprolyl isomerase [Candidatus Woesearchaeota archaeon]|nr:peptidylprolyl isomerase [Candidatus Woesearchaeota archaeon]
MAKKDSGKQKAIIIGSIVFVVALIWAIYYLSSSTPKASAEQAAVVNGEVITMDELKDAYSRVPEAYKEIISENDVLDQIINQKLLIQEAKKAGMVASSEEVSDAVNSIKAQFISTEEFTDYIASQNITLEEIEKNVIDQLMITELINSTVLSKITVSESEISEFYAGNSQEFSAGEGQVRVAHILSDTLNESMEVLSLLNKGEDFAELAVRRSKDDSAVNNNGELGIISNGTMIKEFEDAAFSLKEGELSKPVNTSFGYHIIKRLPNIIPLSEVKDAIREELISQKQSGEIEVYISSLRSKATITKGTQPSQIEANDFASTGDEVCKEAGKPIVRMYTASNCGKCSEAKQAFRKAVASYDVVVREIELDTGDDLATIAKEESLSAEEFAVLMKYDSKLAVPAYVFGCSYSRTGNAFDAFNEESEITEFSKILDELI